MQQENAVKINCESLTFYISPAVFAFSVVFLRNKSLLRCVWSQHYGTAKVEQDAYWCVLNFSILGWVGLTVDEAINRMQENAFKF